MNLILVKVIGGGRMSTCPYFLSYIIERSSFAMVFGDTSFPKNDCFNGIETDYGGKFIKIVYKNAIDF